MKLNASLQARLAFFVRVVGKETRHLQDTDGRLFSEISCAEDLIGIDDNPLLSERLEAFVGRFGRLQDSLADKFLPALLDAYAEPRAAALENLDRAEKLGWVDSADDWIEARRRRNLMVHEYIEDRVILFDALMAGHRFVPTLIQTSSRFSAQAGRLIDAEGAARGTHG